MKKISSILLISIITLGLLAVSSTVLAQSGYTPLQSLPGLEGEIPRSGNLTEYANTVVKITIGVAAALAVIYITIGGITYMTTDAIKGKEDGKEMIKNAVLGLLLAILSVLILQTVNPATLDFNLDNVEELKKTERTDTEHTRETFAPEGTKYFNAYKIGDNPTVENTFFTLRACESSLTTNQQFAELVNESFQVISGCKEID